MYDIYNLICYCFAKMRRQIMRRKVYILSHGYSYGEDLYYDKSRILGVFYTEKEAKEAIKKYKDLPGFNKFDMDCFFVDKYKFDKMEWKSGFVTIYS